MPIRRHFGPFAAAAAPLAMIVVFSMQGCAGGGVPTGDSLLRGGDAAAAVEALREEALLRPDDALVQRNLGVALFEAGRANEAIEPLRTAVAGLPDDPVALYFLGRATEATGDAAGALAAYGRYLSTTDRGRDVVRARMRILAEERARREVRQAVAREASIDAGSLSETTVAVPEYDNVTGDVNLAPLGRGLAVMMMTDLAKIEQLRVVERARLNILQEELGLSGTPVPAGSTPAAAELPPIDSTRGIKARLRELNRKSTGRPYYEGPIDDSTDASYRDAVRGFQSEHDLTVDGLPGPRTQQALDRAHRAGAGTAEPAAGAEPALVDAATAPRLGRLLGAGTLVLGSFAISGTDAVELTASIAGVADGSTRPAGTPVNGPLESVLKLQKDVTFGVLAALGIEAKPEERRAIQALPTESFAAFLAYCRGLDYEARGMPGEAYDAYREAVRLDPDFSLAREEEEIGGVEPGADDAFRAEVRDDAVRGGGDEGVVDRLIRTGGWVGMGPNPDLDRGDDMDPAVTPIEKLENGTIVIEGDVPGGGNR